MISAFAQSAFIDRAGWLLLHSCWEFTLIAMLVTMGLRHIANTRTTVRYSVCLIGMGLIAATPAVTYLLLPPYRATVHVEAPTAQATIGIGLESSQLAPSEVAQEETASHLPRVPSSPVSAATDEHLLATVPQMRRGTVSSLMASWFPPLVSAWCAGVLLFTIRPLWSWYTLGRLRRVGLSPVESSVSNLLAASARRLGLRSAPRIFQSASVAVPIVVGYLRPYILLPASVLSGLTTSQLEAVLLHELAHIRRHDFLVNLLQTWLETLFFYHPAVWWLSYRLRCEREIVATRPHRGCMVAVRAMAVFS